LAFLRTVNAAKTDPFRVAIVQDFDGVAVNYPDDLAGEVGSKNSSWDEQGCQQQDIVSCAEPWSHKVATNYHRVARR
jgi:hypothetical protein